ncbi:uncharacterized protein [Panulirus ornatus]|uniref:uncharacterized protein n=1 Tax=Panulirus ornatus TaxID=150431 RepID=UPI003A8BBF5B
MITEDRGGALASAPRPGYEPWEALLPTTPLTRPVILVPKGSNERCPKCQSGFMYNYVPVHKIMVVVFLGLVGCVVLGVYAYCCLVRKRCAACSHLTRKDLINRDFLREPDTDVSPPPCPVTSWQLEYAV